VDHSWFKEMVTVVVGIVKEMVVIEDCQTVCPSMPLSVHVTSEVKAGWRKLRKSKVGSLAGIEAQQLMSECSGSKATESGERRTGPRDKPLAKRCQLKLSRRGSRLNQLPTCAKIPKHPDEGEISRWNSSNERSRFQKYLAWRFLASLRPAMVTLGDMANMIAKDE